MKFVIYHRQNGEWCWNLERRGKVIAEGKRVYKSLDKTRRDILCIAKKVGAGIPVEVYGELREGDLQDMARIILGAS